MSCGLTDALRIVTTRCYNLQQLQSQSCPQRLLPRCGAKTLKGKRDQASLSVFAPLQLPWLAG